MASVFRTLVSSQEPITPQSRKKASQPKSPEDENEERTASAEPSARKKFNFFGRYKDKKKAQEKQKPDTTGLEVTRDPSFESPTYFSQHREAMEPRNAAERGNRESFADELQTLIRSGPTPELEAQEMIDQPPSRFSDTSSEEEQTGTGRRLKKSLSSWKVSTSNFLARSRAPEGRSGSGGGDSSSSFGLGVSGIDQGIQPAKKTPVIGTPTGFRRLQSAQDWADFNEGSKSASPLLTKSPSTATIAAGTPQKARLGKMPSKGDLRDWFWGKAHETSPTRQRPSDAESTGGGDLLGRSPAYLARAHRRQQAALSIITERPVAPALRPGDAAEESEPAISDSSSFYLSDAESEAVPPPLRVVKQTDTQHLQARRGEDGKIVRSPSFLRRIQEMGEQRQRLQTSMSHPALRTEGAGDSTPVQRGFLGHAALESPQQRPPPPATAPVPQQPTFQRPAFAPRRPSLERAIHDFFSPSDPNLTPEIALRNRLVGNAFFQELRRDVFGLEPLQIVRKGDMKHPNHPLKWETENLMCSGKHNATELASVPGEKAMKNEQSPTNMSALSLLMPRPKLKTKASTTSFTSAKNLDNEIINQAKKCALCGRFCCHFIDLLNYLHSPPTITTPTSGPSTSTPTQQAFRHADLWDERNRIQASANVRRLKQEQPDGLDPYDTFVTCAECGKEVCARCAKRCGEEGCGSVVCAGCGECGAHGG